jgi:hypothetical protein
VRDILTAPKAGKAILGALYLAEGSKGRRSGLTFGNSDASIISLYLRLLRSNFSLDESKFRCTVQRRESQDDAFLRRYWSKVTAIPLAQFYDSRIDPRSVGRRTAKADYKGVCRIDYFSTDLLYEMLALGRILVEGP